MTPTDAHIFAIGLPGTGKTTFLAAFWDVVNTSEVSGSLVLEKLEGDRHQLNEIRDQWADFNNLPRTNLKDEKPVSMTLRSGDRLFALTFDDLSGESFRKQWEEHLCTTHYIDMVRTATGALLFVHPSVVKETVLIRDVNRLARLLPQPIVPPVQAGPQAGGPTLAGQLAPSGMATTARTVAAAPGAASPSGRSAPQGPVGQVTNTQKPKPLPSEPHYASTQVQLVELLQVIEEYANSRPFRVGLVVSAWDRLDKVGLDPTEWVKQTLPLLHQFALANPETITLECFGVSAQGGELTEAEELRRKNIRTSDRIVIVRQGERSRDITLPVKWVLGLVK